MARNAGYSLAEIDRMDINFLLDLLVQQANMNSQIRANASKSSVRKANQNDFDNM